jgi:hypothetical protein
MLLDDFKLESITDVEHRSFGSEAAPAAPTPRIDGRKSSRRATYA